MNVSVRVKHTHKVVCAALLIAAGVLLPQVFHLIGGDTAGRIFLPMHIPVLLAGLLLGPVPGVAVGIVTPLLSFLFTGMPAVAVLPFMLFELFAYGLVSGLLGQIEKAPLYVALVAAQVAGRLANAGCLFIAGTLLHLKAAPAASVVTAFFTGLPGIVVQLVLIPPLVYAVRKVAAHRE